MTTYQFTRPSLRAAANAQEAYDQAHAYASHLIGRLQARHGGSAHRDVRGNWDAAGSAQHLIDLLEDALDA
jgi:hypothetical protein